MASVEVFPGGQIQIQHPLEAEMKTFNAWVGFLLPEHTGEYVLIKGNEVLGIYPDRQDAIKEGYKQLGNTPFLTREIAELEEIIYFL